MIVLDTSALIRFFTNDIPSKAQKVKKLLDGQEKLFIPDVVLTELEYVLLGKNYRQRRRRLIEAFEFLLSQKTIRTTPEAKKALEYYKNTNLDFADCLIAASAFQKRLFSFDKRLLNLVKHK
jgi:predicted nucleic-acid-binding protein